MKRLRVEGTTWCMLGVLFGVLALACVTWPPIHFGALFFGALTAGCGGLGLFVLLSGFSKTLRRIAMLGRVLFALFCASFLLVQGMILAGEYTDPAIYSADYVLVLGAHIYDTGPSAALASRLDTAANLLSENQTASLVLCGGQGPDEIMPEAHMMRDYLLQKGVAPSRLLLEDESSNTIENIDNAVEKFDLLGKKTAVITNEFHLARARRLMQQAGLDACGMPAPTPYFAVRAVSHLREYCSTLGLIITGRYF